MLAYWPAVEADFERYYAMDLREVCWGTERLGVRRLSSLVKGLPPESATARSVNPNIGWRENEELLASLIEVVDHGNRLLFAVNRDKKSTRLPKAIRIPRPWDTSEKPPQSRRPASGAQVEAFFAKRGRVS